MQTAKQSVLTPAQPDPNSIAHIDSRSVLRGAGFVLAAELMFATMGAAVKACSPSLPFETIVFFRNAFSLFILLPLLLRDRAALLKTSILPVHLLRATLGTSALYCFFYTLGQLPLAQGMLFKMTPPIFVPLIAFLVLKEKTPVYALLAIPLGFAGVWIILNPQGGLYLPALIGMLGGLLAACVNVTLQNLGRTEPAMRIVFYFTLISTLLSAIPLYWTWKTPVGKEWLLLLLMGITGAIGQVLMTRGYATAPAARIGPFIFAAVIYGSIYGYIFWDEKLAPSFYAGTTLIFFAILMALKAHSSTRQRLV